MIRKPFRNVSYPVRSVQGCTMGLLYCFCWMLSFLCVHSNRAGFWKQSYIRILRNRTTSAGKCRILSWPASCAGRTQFMKLLSTFSVIERKCVITCVLTAAGTVSTVSPVPAWPQTCSLKTFSQVQALLCWCLWDECVCSASHMFTVLSRFHQLIVYQQPTQSRHSKYVVYYWMISLTIISKWIIPLSYTEIFFFCSNNQECMK